MPDARPVPAYFLSLELENVRCFGPRQKLDLSDSHGRPAQWTLILGDNGVGKTTLLQCLAAMQPVEEEELKTTEGKPLWEPRLFHYSAPEIALVRHLKEFSDIEATYVFSLPISQRSKPIGEAVFRVKEHGQKTGEHNALFEPRFRSFFLVAYGASRRMGGTDLGADETSDYTATLFDSRASLFNVEELLLRMDYRSLIARRKGKMQERLEQVLSMLVELLPDVSDIAIDAEPGDEGSIRKGFEGSVRFATPYGQVSLADLSLGYQAMIAWTVDLASRLIERYPEAANPLIEPAVVLVDEIDLHLHPRWQRQILDYLSQRFPNVQFIATAHSPLVAQAACEAGMNLALLRREGDHVVIDNDPNVVRTWRVDQILTSELFAGVEGPRGPETEKLIQEHKTLLQKRKLTTKDKARVKEIEEELGELPTESSPADQRAMDIIRRAAKILG